MEYKPKPLRGIAFFIFLLVFTFIYIVGRSFVGMWMQEMGMNVDAIFGSLWYIVFHLFARLFVPLALWMAVFREKTANVIPNARLGGKNIGYIVALSFLLQPAAMTLSGLMALFFPNQASEMVLERLDQPFALMLLAMAVAPAVFEELAFRGYIQSMFSGMKLWVVALCGGVMFAIMHLNLQQALYTFAMGVLFVLVVHHTKSIRAGILMHFIVNASQVSLLKLATLAADWADNVAMETGIYVPEIEITFRSQLAVVVAIGFVAIFTTIGAVIIYRKLVSHNLPALLENDSPEQPEQ
jgi:membrane protease YdiL (CAAX protease family)